MSAVMLIRDLARRGVSLGADGDRIQIDAPPGVITDSDRADLRACKNDLLALLSGGIDTVPGALAPTSASLPKGTRVEVLVAGEWHPATVVGVWDDDDLPVGGPYPDRRGFVEVVRDDATVAPDGERTNTLVPPSAVRALPSPTVKDVVQIVNINSGVAGSHAIEGIEDGSLRMPPSLNDGARCVEVDKGTPPATDEATTTEVDDMFFDDYDVSAKEQAPPSLDDQAPDSCEAPAHDAPAPRRDDLLDDLFTAEELAEIAAQGEPSVVSCKMESEVNHDEVDDVGQVYLMPAIVDQGAIEAEVKAEKARQRKLGIDAISR